jgi:DNA-binding MarR family transcriptional regulator
MGKANVQGVLGQVARIREQANLLIERELADRSMVGIMPAHGSVLHFLFEQQAPVPIKAVVEAVGRVKSTVTGMLNTLESHGYVRRTPSDQDGRVTCVALTAKGAALREDFDEISRRLLTQLYGTMPRQDRELLVDLLARLDANLRDR